MADKVQVTLGLLAKMSQEKCVWVVREVAHPVFFNTDPVVYQDTDL